MVMWLVPFILVVTICQKWQEPLVNSPDLYSNEGRVHSKVSIIMQLGAVNWCSLPQSCSKLRCKIVGISKRQFFPMIIYVRSHQTGNLVTFVVSIKQVSMLNDHFWRSLCWFSVNKQVKSPANI